MSSLKRIWPRYFPEVLCDDEDARFKLASSLLSFFRTDKGHTYLAELAKVAPEREYVPLHIDFSEFRRDCHVRTLVSLLIEDPEGTIPCIGLAAHASILDSMSSGSSHWHAKKLNVRIHNFTETTSFRDLKANFLGKFVSIRGTVVRTSVIKPLVVRMTFQCAKCESELVRHFPDGKYTPPSKCSRKKCRSQTFNPVSSSAESIDWQKVRIQEVRDRTDQREAGRIPRTIECELLEDLVDSCVPGDEVTVNGVVKVMSAEGAGRRGAKSQLYFLYIDANAISNAKSLDNGKMDLLQFSPRDLMGIREIAYQPNLFPLLVHSLCPSIYGHELVKAGLCLALFGGVAEFDMTSGKGTTIPIRRGDCHVLVVGDPGLGKSQLLTAVSHVAPRGVYVCGNNTSSAGLTVSVVKDSVSGDFALEAGALVLGDQGVCCIDEFDKMTADYQSILEAMEQQCVSIAKAGLVCSLPARTCVLAAANPVGGHYNRAKTVAENLKMSPAVLSRFDLTFILLDSPDEFRDQLLSEHVMALHKGRSSTGNSSHQRSNTVDSWLGRQVDDSTRTNAGESGAQKRMGLRELLMRTAATMRDPIPAALMRKYIGYARKYVSPVLTKEAKKILNDFYLSLRRSHHSADCAPVTGRQLESLIRLSQARARAELREEITAEDAQDVVDVMKESLYDMLVDEFGQLDFRRQSGMSNSKQAQVMISELTRRADQRGSNVFTVQEMYTISTEVGIRVPDFQAFVDSMNNQNYLLKSGPRTYRLTTSSASGGGARGTISGHFRRQ